MRKLVIGLLLLVAACANQHPGTHRQLVYFTEWSAKLDETAQAAVTASADFVKQHPAGVISVIGYADPEGSSQANLDLSRARAQMVVDALIAAGVPAERIRRDAKGETAYVQNSLESRRVEIVFGNP
jgi:outer membrane protein OmpA-like peptidoglycan-associated protein